MAQYNPYQHPQYSQQYQYPQTHFHQSPQPHYTHQQQQQPYPHPQHHPASPQQQYPYAQQHPQYAQPPPPQQRPRSSIGGHGHSHSVPVAHYSHPPPVAPSAWQAQAMQPQVAYLQPQLQPRSTGRPLPAPKRADTLPSAAPAAYAPQQPPYPAHPGPPSRANSTSTTSRPLPTPASSSIQPGIPRSPGRHHSLDLGRPRDPSPEKAVSRQASQPETPSQIRRRASPPRFTGGSGSWTEVAPRRPQPPENPSPAGTVSKGSDFKDLLSGPAPQLEGGKFVPLWKRALITNGPTAEASTGRPLPSPTKTPTAPASNGLKRGGSLHVRAPASAVSEKSPTPSPEPSDDGSESESDAETRASVPESRPDDSEEEETDSETEAVTSPVSPSYGIRDLPRPPSMDARASTSALPQPPPMRGSAFEGRSAPGIIENSGSSRTLMFAAAELASSGNMPSGWPAGVPPLPRTPGSSIRRDVGDLEDSPPVSSMSAIRRGTSASSSSGISGLPGSPLKSPSFGQSKPPIPTFSFDGPPDPPPAKKSVPTFSFSGPSGASSKPAAVPAIPAISLPDDGPSVPKINIPGDDDDDSAGPIISIEEYDPNSKQASGITSSNGVQTPASRALPANPPNTRQLRGISCGGCDKYIVGRIVNAMKLRWHPDYEKDGRAYCHLDYHENFAPRCFSCKTPIVDESFISLDDPELGRRTYHEQHFFCSECGDPFLPPSQPTAKGELAFSGDGAFMSDDVGFTVYKGYPYCEACHVRLRLPKCKKCKKSIRDHDQAVEALGGKWSDNDQYAHVNNATYYFWFDSVINTFLQQVCGQIPTESPYIGLVVSSYCEFYSPVSFPQEVDVGLRVVQLGKSSVKYEVGVFVKGEDAPYRIRRVKG
ncbi:Flap endonuclease 1 [Mycena kentingensis (nom. inval.)]|nr:Flap endonuclease 1 [Mycena kentingensis (nom. inval.)]